MIKCVAAYSLIFDFHIQEFFSLFKLSLPMYHQVFLLFFSSLINMCVSPEKYGQMSNFQQNDLALVSVVEARGRIDFQKFI